MFCLQAMSQHRSLRSLQHRVSSRQRQPSLKLAGCGRVDAAVRDAAALSATTESQSKLLLVGPPTQVMCLSSKGTVSHGQRCRSSRALRVSYVKSPYCLWQCTVLSVLQLTLISVHRRGR